jgi:hypothetical protein
MFLLNPSCNQRKEFIMERIVEREDVWAASIEDKPGALSQKLTALAEAGADLDFVVARRSPEKPGTGVVFVTPLRGDKEVQAATSAGFTVTQHLHSVRIEGDNEPGLAGQLTQQIGAAGINLRGLSGAVIGTKFVLHAGVDTAEDAAKLMKLVVL